MARNGREIIAIVLDIGQSVSKQKCENGKSYLDNARTCISMILQRKLFGNRKDLLGLFLLSSNESINSLDYEGIELKFPMSIASWNMLRFVEKEVKSTEKNSDWMSAIIVGMQYIKDEIDGTSFPITAKKLILFTNFASPISDDDEEVDQIINGLKSLGIELIIIGVNVIPSSSYDEGNGVKLEDGTTMLKTEMQESGEALISKITTDVGGVICSFDDAVPQLQYFETKKVKPTPWNVVMDIGEDIKIPVSGFKKIANVTLPSWKVISVQSTEQVDRDRSQFKLNAEQTPVMKEDVILGYTFGSTIVPFSDVDASTMQYQSGPRCLSVIGFTKASLIPTHLLVGDGIHYIVPRAGDPNAGIALSALINALHKDNMVAIARKVYNANNCPTVGALIPKVRDDYECLVLVELPYSEDMRQYVFPSLSKTAKPTATQLDCVDKLIDSMDLMVASKDEEGEPSEAFHPKRNLNPYHQHFYQSLCDRGLNPDSPLPPVKQTILDLLVSPFQTNSSANEALRGIRENFPLVEIKQKEVRKTAADLFKRDNDDDDLVVTNGAAANATTAVQTTMAEITSKTIVQIGTINPVKDFDTLLDGGQNFTSVAKEMGDVIINLVLRSFGSDDFDKAAQALEALRQKCVAKNNPGIYNELLVELKDKIIPRGKKAFWELIVQGNLGLITNNEDVLSHYDFEAATKFLIIPDAVCAEPDQDQNMDAEDLLNEM